MPKRYLPAILRSLPYATGLAVVMYLATALIYRFNPFAKLGILGILVLFTVTGFAFIGALLAHAGLDKR